MDLANASEALKASFRHIIVAEALKEDATADLDHVKEHLDDEAADIKASSADQRKSLALGRIARAQGRLSLGRQHRIKVRELLWPPDEDAAGG